MFIQTLIEQFHLDKTLLPRTVDAYAMDTLERGKKTLFNQGGNE